MNGKTVKRSHVKRAGSGQSDILAVWLNIGWLGQFGTILEKEDHTHTHKHVHMYNLLVISRLYESCF